MLGLNPFVCSGAPGRVNYLIFAVRKLELALLSPCKSGLEAANHKAFATKSRSKALC
jgi:hypothetical protein